MGLRFKVGDVVEAFWKPDPRMPGTWLTATVTALHFSHPNWPKEQLAPYQLRLNDGTLIVAPHDDDQCVRELPPSLDSPTTHHRRRASDVKHLPEQVIEASTQGNVKAVEQWLRAGPNRLEVTGKDGRTLLMCASYATKGGPVVSALLKNWFPALEARDAMDYTALMFAIVRGHLEVVEQLIAAGAQINRADSRGATPLHLAVFLLDVPLVALLLTKGADKTAVHSELELDASGIALATKNERIIAMLKGDEVRAALGTAQNARAWLATTVAQRMSSHFGHPVLQYCANVRAILQKQRALMDNPSSTSKSPVRAGSRLKKNKSTREAEQIIMAVPSSDDTAQNRAAMNPVSPPPISRLCNIVQDWRDTTKRCDNVNQIEVSFSTQVGVFVAAGGDIDETLASGRTLLMVVCALGSTNLVKSLIDAGASVNKLSSPPQAGISTLLIAAAEGHEAVVELLLQAKANPDPPNLSERSAVGWAPIIAAAGIGERGIIRRLLQAGARTDFRHPMSGSTASESAELHGHCAAALLCQAGGEF